ncbi:hypothetical protein AL542_04865 [Grimontia hollisae]|uniref:AAA family ATPase n=1 Tax=Grimontia hollisae TaxID=673 RepID=UPI00058E8B71|nr:AAA family ATPase [Grimontia hollisae]AMG29789.1 hypothetical protein AL542_04865 [Grimontia hollisae]STO43354.1 Uncharacterised protein [Grimontia hollisae]
MIVLIGPDGCGKTTIAEKIISNKACYDEIRSKNFGIIPQAKFINKAMCRICGKDYINKYEHKEGEYMAGMKHRPNSLFKEVILFMWYLLDYILGHFHGKRKNIIFTRYYYDYFYQRQHINLPKWMPIVFHCLIPKPSFVFFLHQNPIDIYNRKPELSLEEIQRQNEEIIKLKNRFNIIEVDASKGIDATYIQILRILT